jgi:hypothetical protein
MAYVGGTPKDKACILMSIIRMVEESGLFLPVRAAAWRSRYVDGLPMLAPKFYANRVSYILRMVI